MASAATAAASTTELGSTAASGGGVNFKQEKAAPTQQQQQPISPQDFYGNPAYGYPGGAIRQSVPVLGATPPAAAAQRKWPSRQAAPWNPDYSFQAGQRDQNGLPLPGEPGSPLQGPPAPLPGEPGSPFADPVAPSSFADRFNASGAQPAQIANSGGSNVLKGSDQNLKQQTDTLKQSDTQNSKTVADAVKEQAKDTQSVGDKTNQSLQGVQDAAKQTSQATDGGIPPPKAVLFEGREGCRS